MGSRFSGSRAATLYFYFLREFYRSRAFGLMFVLVAGIAAAVVLLTHFDYDAIVPFIAPPPTGFARFSPELRTQFLYYIWSYIGVIIPPLAASFYSSSAISGDFESGAIIPLLTLPVSKGKILMSRMLASFTAIALSMALYEGIQFLDVGFAGSGISPVLLLLSFALMILFTFSCNSMAFAIGAFFRKGTHSTIVFLMLFYIVFNVLSITILLGLHQNPLFILNNAGGIVDRVFADLNPVLFFSGGSISGAGLPEIMYSAEVMLLYSIALTMLAYTGFTRTRRQL